MGHSPGLQEKERSGIAREELIIQTWGGLQNYLLPNTAPEHVKLHLYQHPSSRIHLFITVVFPVIPVLQMLNVEKRGQIQTFRISVCLV